MLMVQKKKSLALAFMFLMFVVVVSFFALCPGYSSFDNYNGFSNYCYGSSMFDERMRGERGMRGKVQTLITFGSLESKHASSFVQLLGLSIHVCLYIGNNLAFQILVNIYRAEQQFKTFFVCYN